MEAHTSGREAIKNNPALPLDDEMAYFYLVENPSASLTTVGPRDCKMNVAVRADLYLTPAVNNVAIGTVAADLN